MLPPLTEGQRQRQAPVALALRVRTIKYRDQTSSGFWTFAGAREANAGKSEARYIPAFRE